MKKITAVILIVLICFSASACKDSEKSETSSSITISDTSSESNMSSDIKNTSKPYVSSKQDKPTSSKPLPPSSSSSNLKNSSLQPEDSYQSIECIVADGYREARILPKGSKTHIVLNLPNNCEIKKSEKDFVIFRGANKIGTISEGLNTSGEVKYNEDYSYLDVSVKYQINKMAPRQYNHIFTYTYVDADDKTFTVSMCVPYKELDQYSVDSLIYDFATASYNENNISGILPIDDERKKILILGNSFIATSRIGTTLQEMCGDDYIVEAQSRGLAQVSIYEQDTYILDRIRAGEFSVLFMCGFYANYDVTSFGTFVDACNSSNTKIAIFPAHNERYANISLAQQRYEQALLIDWRREIEGFIESGISIWEFCIDDGYKHSKPLAGYVGAHMIYRSIYGKVPTRKSFSQVSTYEINLLGRYKDTGLIYSSDTSMYMHCEF